jgi:hypothetical protein
MGYYGWDDPKWDLEEQFDIASEKFDAKYKDDPEFFGEEVRKMMESLLSGEQVSDICELQGSYERAVLEFKEHYLEDCA